MQPAGKSSPETVPELAGWLPYLAEGSQPVAEQVPPDRTRIVHVADLDTDNVSDLYVSDDPPVAVRAWNIYE
jgi:hypothetical protein